MDNILASSISDKAHLVAFDTIIANRFAELDFSCVLMNLMDRAPSNALPYLLNQFDLLGYKGLRFATTELEQRALLKKAIELHKYKGTRWSIKEALKLIGVTESETYTGVDKFLYDGNDLYDGSNGYNDTTWALFLVKINAATFSTITDEIAADIINLVLEYKSARSKLYSIVGLGAMYNGVHNYDGTFSYDTQQFLVP